MIFKFFTYLILLSYLIIVIILTFFYGQQRLKVIFTICIITLITKSIHLLFINDLESITDLPLSTLSGFLLATSYIFIVLFKETKSNELQKKKINR